MILLCYVISQQVYEVVPCHSDCGQYVWVAEPWSVWKVSNVDLKENCGEGVQTRKVRYDVISFYTSIQSQTLYRFSSKYKSVKYFFEGVCRIQLMDLQIRWRIIFVTQRKCLLEPERANCLVQKTVSCPIGAPGVDAHW